MHMFIQIRRSVGILGLRALPRGTLTCDRRKLVSNRLLHRQPSPTVTRYGSCLKVNDPAYKQLRWAFSVRRTDTAESVRILIILGEQHIEPLLLHIKSNQFRYLIRMPPGLLP
ncbi:hypothetical protein GOODEAATRI_013059 [Goodea atripinnis]|uniref:Uncharacterized protein n=1 Tax=Goodea atripinnis TaxID=208336 RepID=A0ABV0NA95_9TELE